MPRMKFLRAGTVLWLVFLASFALAEETGEKSPEAALTLSQALAMALKSNPELETFSEGIRIREAETLQSGLRPNPVLSVDVENLGGSGELSGVDATETTLALSQLVELGDKRGLRRALAEADSALARNEYELARVDVLGRTTRQFVAVLAAQERLLLSQELVQLARRSLETVEERIEGGKAAATEAIRARIQLAELQMSVARIGRELSAARRELAALLGGETLPAGRLSGDLSRLPHLPGRDALLALVDQSPEVARWASEMERRDRALKLEGARRIPDLEITVGARHENETDDSAFVAALSVPLPLFDRNQGNIAAARSRLVQARAEARRAGLEARSALNAAWQQMSAAHEEAETLRDAILPAAQQAFEAAEYGYRAGKFGLLDVLDAQRTLIEARERHLAALADFHRAAADIERLLGRELPTLSLNASEKKENNPS